MQKELEARSFNACELCTNQVDLTVFAVYPYSDKDANHNILICANCNNQIEDPSKMDQNHWRCLIESVWSEADAVKVVSWRVLDRLRSNGIGWATDLQDMMYMDEATSEWAKDVNTDVTRSTVHKDSNGVVLNAGDSIVLIKDLDVKGSSLTAKRGAAVRNIRLDPDNEEYIEGKVDGQTVVIITKYVKKI